MNDNPGATATRFILQGANRSGTHFLQSLLHDHPEVDCYWDLFWNNDVTELGFKGYKAKHPPKGLFRSAREKHAIDGFLSHHYANHSTSKASGFLVKSERMKSSPAILRWLKANDAKVILLVRENLLSREIALALRRQKIVQGHARKPQEATPVSLDTTDILKRFRRSAAQLDWHRNALKQVQSMEIVYETLIAKQDDVFSQLCDFLGVERVLEVKSEFFKTESEDPAQMLLNYDEVRRALSASEFSHLLP